MTPRCLLLAAVATALATSIAEAQTHRTIALIVTSNRGASLDRPELQYADDDGAKYYTTFRTVAAPADVHLLTRFDRDTARLFPELANTARPPTRASLAAAASAIARDVAAERARGAEVDFYFVFAGHGDVDDGRGFLELADGRFDSADLEAMVQQIAPTRAHVMLDSCNSFFVLNARKPGGRRFATPADIARSLGQRMPNVGVFLSTSAEAEVYEWSELQSGIFSHAVRSGLAGAADANGDGQVSYEELAAFVDTAAAEIKNPAFRPKVYARGPGGTSAATLFRPSTATAMRVELQRDAQVRVTIRDREGIPWYDVFKEPGAAVTVQVPDRLAEGTIDEYDLARGAIASRRLGAAGTREVLALAALPVSAEVSAPRGPSDSFRALFQRPFGPHAFAAYRAAALTAPPVILGISREDTHRMSLMLEQIGKVERRSRLFGAAGLLGTGALALGAGVYFAREPQTFIDTGTRTLGYVLMGTGAVGLIGGGIALLRPSSGERLRDQLVKRLAAGDDPSAVVARTEDQLAELARGYRQTRAFMLAGGLVAVAGAVSLAAISESRDNPVPLSMRFGYSGLALAGGLLILTSRFEYPIESMSRMWLEDPGIRKAPRWTVNPIDGGAALTVAGAF